MGEHNRPIDCPWCRNRHGRRFLCDPVAAMLDAMKARGESYNLPTLELQESIPGGLAGEDGPLVAQLVVKAGMIPAGGVTHPALVFTGRTVTGPLPQWVYPTDDRTLRATARLVHDMAELAIRKADEANAGRRA